MQNHTMESFRDKMKCFNVELLNRISPDVLVDEMTCLSLSTKQKIKALQEAKGARQAAGLFLERIVCFNGFEEQFLLALRNNKLGDLADKLSGNRQQRNVTSQPPHSFMGPGGGDMPPTIPNSLPMGDPPPPYDFESSEPEDCTNNNNNSSSTKPSALEDSSYTKRQDIPIYEQDQREQLSKCPLPQVTSTESELIPCDSASNASNKEPHHNQSNLTLNQFMTFIGSNERPVFFNIPPSSHGNHESLEKNLNVPVMPANSMSSMEGTGKCHPNIDAILNGTSAGSADLESLSGESSHKSVYNTSDLEFSVSKTLTSGKVMMSEKTLPSSSCLANDSSVDKTLPTGTDSPGKGRSDCIEITCENDREQEDTSDHNINDAEYEVEPSLQLNQVEPNEPAENNRGVLATILQGIWFVLTLEDLR